MINPNESSIRFREVIEPIKIVSESDSLALSIRDIDIRQNNARRGGSAAIRFKDIFSSLKKNSKR